MKKIFTLALTLFILNAAFSQTVVSRFSVQTPNFGINYDRNYGNDYNNNYYGNDYDRRYRIEHINAIYEQQMHEIMCMPISTGRKIRLIHRLQIEKARKIEHVNVTSGYNNYNGRYNDNNSWKR